MEKMNKSIMFFAFFILFATVLNAQSLDKVKLATKTDSISYAIGMDIAVNLKSQNIDVNPEVLAKGLIDNLTSKNLLLTEEQKVKVIEVFQQEHTKKQEEIATQKASENVKAGQDFLAKNAKKPGVIVTASGLQYEIITEGTGKTPSPTSKVTVHYEGKLVDGTVFDSSYKRGETISFPLNGVIQGWQEGLQLLKEGGKAMLYIPSNLGYGEKGAGNIIPGNSTLIFTVELFKVEDQFIYSKNNYL